MTRAHLYLACALVLAVSSCTLRYSLALEQPPVSPAQEARLRQMEAAMDPVFRVEQQCARRIVYGDTVVCISREHLDRMRKEGRSDPRAHRSTLRSVQHGRHIPAVQLPGMPRALAEAGGADEPRLSEVVAGARDRQARHRSGRRVPRRVGAERMSLYDDDMPKPGTCAACRFVNFIGNDPLSGECRREVPRRAHTLYERWPRVLQDDWCGQYEERKP